MLLLAIGMSLLFLPMPTHGQDFTPTPTPTATPTLTARQEYYLERNWAFEPDMLPTPTPWPRTLPCEEPMGTYPVYEKRVLHWAGWIEWYRDYGWHDIPLEIALAVIMHESRGSQNALACAGEIGLFQLLPSDAVFPIPNTCARGEDGRRTFEGNHPSRILAQTAKNIWIGLDHLEDLTWPARAYVQDLQQTWEEAYRPEIVAVPEASDLEWWYTEEGRVAVAMHQCGPAGYRRGYCGRWGGDVYAGHVLDCWVPWVQEVLGIESNCTETEFMLKLVNRQLFYPLSYINLSRRK